MVAVQIFEQILNGLHAAILQVVARTLDEAPDLGVPTSVDDVLAAERWAREHARAAIAGAPSAPSNRS